MKKTFWHAPAIFPLFVVCSAMAQEPSDAVGTKLQILDGIRSSFSFPWKTLGEPPSLHDFWDKEFSANVAFNTPLTPASVPTGAGRGTEGDRGSSSPNISITVKDNPITFWYALATFDLYFRPELQRTWNPDFTYSFGYDDWHPYTFSLTYSNYGGNRLSPNRRKKERFTTVEQGGIDLGWKFKLPGKMERPFLDRNDATFGWSVHYGVVPRYGDLASNKTLSWKQAASLSCTNNLYKFFYWTATVRYYPLAGQQQPWDPDFTYGFGYFDYRPGKISVEYNNYAGNRYPWRHQGRSAGGFRSGGISIVWSVR
jgi:hypothetical protein